MTHKIYLDTEFNSFGGFLISLALVSTDGGELYVEFPHHLPRDGSAPYVHPWVRDNVLPLLEGKHQLPTNNKAQIAAFLMSRQDQEIIADWPEDFTHLMNCICDKDGMRPNLDLRFHLTEPGHGYSEASEVPHHALHDARALMKAHQASLPVPGDATARGLRILDALAQRKGFNNVMDECDTATIQEIAAEIGAVK
jgi:hypothetical protein